MEQFHKNPAYRQTHRHTDRQTYGLIDLQKAEAEVDPMVVNRIFTRLETLQFEPWIIFTSPRLSMQGQHLTKPFSH